MNKPRASDIRKKEIHDILMREDKEYRFECAVMGEQETIAKYTERQLHRKFMDDLKAKDDAHYAWQMEQLRLAGHKVYVRKPRVKTPRAVKGTP